MKVERTKTEGEYETEAAGEFETEAAREYEAEAGWEGYKNKERACLLSINDR
jgi:hypothetical protein